MQVGDSAMWPVCECREGPNWERVIDDLRAEAGSEFERALVEPFIEAVHRELERSRSV